MFSYAKFDLCKRSYCKNAQALFQYFVVPHFIIMLQIVLHKHIWSLNHLFSFYEVYIKHHFFLKSIATNNLDVSIWQVYMIITLSPFRSCHVIQIFKWPHPHHRHIVKLWSNTAPSPSLSIDSTSRLRLCGWLMHTPPSSEFSIKCAWNKQIWFGQTDKRRDAVIWIMEHGSRSITPIICQLVSEWRSMC